MKILLTGAFRYNEDQLNQIRALNFEITYIQDERLPLDIDVSSFDVVICNSLFLYNDIKAFKSLKFIQLTSAGLDRIPINYLKEKSIRIENAQGIYSIPIAEWTILKILEIYKKSRTFYEAQKNHNWVKHRDLLELYGKSAAIIGMGSVGKEIAKLLKAFGLKINGVDKYLIESEFIDKSVLIDDLDDAIKTSDIIILTLPLTEETYHLIDKKMISKIKDDSVLVNPSRGSVIDEIALIEALKKGKFLGIALDVFEEEPLADNSELWDFDNVIISPHNSFASNKTNERMFNLILSNISSIA